MATEMERIAERLGQEGEKARDFFAALSPQDLGQQVYTEGASWSVKYLLAHLAATEATVLETFRNLLAGGPGLAETFDIDAFNEREAARRSQVPPGVLLNSFSADRQALIKIVQTLREEDLDRRGRHPWLGWTTFREMLQLVYRHSMLHIRDARRALESRYPVPPSGVRPPVAARTEKDLSRQKDLLSFLEASHNWAGPRLKVLVREHLEVLVYPGDPAWRVREVVAHLADAEQGLLGQAQRVAAGKPALPQGFDLARWNRRAVEKRASNTPEEHLAEIEAGFHQWMDFVASLDKERLEMQGVNAEGARVTVEQFARQAAQHRLDHVRDMDRAARGSV